MNSRLLACAFLAAGSRILSAQSHEEARKWAEETLPELTLPEKVAQMICEQMRGGYVAEDADDYRYWSKLAREYGIGGFVVYVVVRRAREAGARTIVLSFGNPYLVEDLRDVSAFVVGYGEGGFYGNQIVYADAFLRLLKGEIEAKGKLPVSLGATAKRTIVKPPRRTGSFFRALGLDARNFNVRDVDRILHC